MIGRQLKGSKWVSEGGVCGRGEEGLTEKNGDNVEEEAKILKLLKGGREKKRGK